MVAPFRSVPFRSVPLCSGIFSIYINACCAAFKYVCASPRWCAVCGSDIVAGIVAAPGSRSTGSRLPAHGLLSTCVTCHFGLGANSPVRQHVKKRAHAIYTRFFHISFWVFQRRLLIFPSILSSALTVLFFFLPVSLFLIWRFHAFGLHIFRVCWLI